MTSFAPSADSTIITAKTYFDFVLKLVLVVGVAFVLPVFLVLLNFAGVISAKSILKSWRVAILLIVLFTAIATPAADILSMFLLAIPMVLLYFAAAGITWLHDRRKAKKAQLVLDDPDIASELPPSEHLSA
jgi:sec-independent protein translocase protein TatC